MTVSKATYDRYADAMQLVSDKGKEALARILPTFDTSSDEAFLADLQRVIPPLVSKYGKVSALLSARFYDRARATTTLDDDYIATTFDGDLKTVESKLGYIATSGLGSAAVASFLAGTVDTGIKSYGRNTQMGNANADPFCNGYESIPGANPCAFCIIKALNTWTYHKYQGDVLEEEVTDDAWHNNCNCQLVPVFRDDPLPEWVDYEALQEAYDNGRALAEQESENGRLSLTDVTAGMRSASDGEITH